MITYTETKKLKGGIGTKQNVKLDGRIVGSIVSTIVGAQYTPKGQYVGGEVFKNVFECKKSLES